VARGGANAGGPGGGGGRMIWWLERPMIATAAALVLGAPAVSEKGK